MEDRIQGIRQQIIRLGKQLADLEAQRAQFEHNVPSDVWEKFTQVSRELDQAEQSIMRINQETTAEINQLRHEIIDKLAQYNHWREQMREMEELFLVNILHPGYTLKQAIRQREYLDQEYWRMRRGIETQQYLSLEDLEVDIRRVLVHGETAFEADERSFVDEQLQEKSAWEMLDKLNLDELVEDFEKDHLIREFKRVVLPAVHPDTSNTPEDIFKTVFETYEKHDFLLMEAYIVEYRGEIELDPDRDILETQDQLARYQQEYHRLSGRLERRMAFLKKKLAPGELEDPEKVESELRQQRQELHKRIRGETEMIFNLREKIEGLVQVYLDHNLGAKDER